MRVKLFWVASLVLSVSATSCRAQQDVEWVEQVPFGLSIFASPQVAVFQDTLTLYADASALAGHGPEGRVRVTLPEGLTLVSGDTAFSVSVRRVLPPHHFTVRAEHPGTFEVRGTLSIATAPGEEDFYDIGLPVAVAGDTLTPGSPIVHRIESRRGGRRFRYAGSWLIPIDEGEVFDAAAFERSGTRARATGALVSACPECPSAGADTALFVVVIDKNGDATNAHALGLPGRHGLPDARVVAAVRATLSRSRFQPARLNGQPVADWLYVRIPVVR